MTAPSAELAAIKHRYELVAMINGTHQYPHIHVGNYVRPATGEGRAVDHAIELMIDRPDIEHCRVYHTHPSPGPVRRYVGLVRRGDPNLHRAG